MKVLPILIFALISITGCKKYDFGETPDWHYLIVDDTYAPSWEGKTWVHYTCDYETQNDLYVEPIKYCDWVSDFDVKYEKCMFPLTQIKQEMIGLVCLLRIAKRQDKMTRSK